MNLKNYTSSVPAYTTIARIEAYLAECGVSGVSKQYESGQPIALAFHVEIGKQRYTIRLPAKVKEVQHYLYKQYVSSRVRPRDTATLESFYEQAVRTAWRIQQDWVEVQMSLIKLGQADFREVFMAFIWDGKQTYFESMRPNNFKQLPESTT